MCPGSIAALRGACILGKVISIFTALGDEVKSVAGARFSPVGPRNATHNPPSHVTASPRTYESAFGTRRDRPISVPASAAAETGLQFGMARVERVALEARRFLRGRPRSLAKFLCVHG